MEVAPEALTQDEACTLESAFSIKVPALAALFTKTFGGMVPLTCAVAAVATLVGANEGLCLGSTEVLVLEALGVETFGKMVPVAVVVPSRATTPETLLLMDDKSKGDDLGSLAVEAPATVATFGGSTESFNA